MLYKFITQGCCTFAARPHRSFVAFRPFGEVSSVIRGLVCLTHPLTGVTACWCVKHTNPSSAQVSARVTVRGRPCKRGPHQARTRVFSDVTQFDLTSKARPAHDGGARHQLRASMSAGKFFSQRLSLRRQRQPRHFFCWEEFTLARARQGFYAGQVARPGGSDAGQECDAGKHKWHLCFRSASELETGTNHFLVAARVEFGTGNRHVPFFRSCPAWSSAWSSPQSWGDKKKSVLQSSHGRTGIFVTLVPPMSRKRGWASPYSLGEPVLIGRAIKRGWASQY